MALQVKWTLNAVEDYQQIVEYLENFWSKKSAEDFIELTEARIERLSQFPLLGIKSDNDSSLRSIVLTSHNRLYYKVTAEAITILNIFDTRQKPQIGK